MVWQMAEAFEEAQDAIADQNYETAKGQASTAANLARALLPTGSVPADELQVAIKSAGEVWTLAHDAAGKTGRASGGDMNAPIVDQYELPHSNNGAFCGIATMIMMLRANQIEQGSGTADLNELARQVYHPGQGTSGAQMAGVLRDRGLEGSTYTTTGTRSKLVETLDQGQTVPFGVEHSEGTIMRLEGGSSSRYRSAKVGDSHYHKFGASGHWVLVVRYEGKAEAPTGFIVNDPDLGGELRCTPEQLDAMGVGSGNYWMVHQ
jgi:hypothetical protein